MRPQLGFAALVGSSLLLLAAACSPAPVSSASGEPADRDVKGGASSGDRDPEAAEPMPDDDTPGPSASSTAPTGSAPSTSTPPGAWCDLHGNGALLCADFEGADAKAGFDSVQPSVSRATVAGDSGKVAVATIAGSTDQAIMTKAVPATFTTVSVELDLALLASNIQSSLSALKVADVSSKVDGEVTSTVGIWLVQGDQPGTASVVVDNETDVAPSDVVLQPGAWGGRFRLQATVGEGHAAQLFHDEVPGPSVASVLDEEADEFEVRLGIDPSPANGGASVAIDNVRIVLQ